MTSVGRVLRRDAVASAFFLMLATGKVFLLSDWLFMFWNSYLYNIQSITMSLIKLAKAKGLIKAPYELIKALPHRKD